MTTLKQFFSPPSYPFSSASGDQSFRTLFTTPAGVSFYYNGCLALQATSVTNLCGLMVTRAAPPGVGRPRSRVNVASRSNVLRQGSKKKPHQASPPSRVPRKKKHPPRGSVQSSPLLLSPTSSVVISPPGSPSSPGSTKPRPCRDERHRQRGGGFKSLTNLQIGDLSEVYLSIDKVRQALEAETQLLLRCGPTRSQFLPAAAQSELLWVPLTKALGKYKAGVSRVSSVVAHGREHLEVLNGHLDRGINWYDSNSIYTELN